MHSKYDSKTQYLAGHCHLTYFSANFCQLRLLKNIIGFFKILLKEYCLYLVSSLLCCSVYFSLLGRLTVQCIFLRGFCLAKHAELPAYVTLRWKLGQRIVKTIGL